MPQVEVRAYRGPAAGRRMMIDEKDVKSATDPKKGWAHGMQPGDVMLPVDTNFPTDPAWKIPGYEPPAPSPEAKAEAKESAPAKTETKEPEPERRPVGRPRKEE